MRFKHSRGLAHEVRRVPIGKDFRLQVAYPGLIYVLVANIEVCTLRRLEDPLAAARREFHEEICFVAMEPFIAQVHSTEGRQGRK
jgi:hypothetical protein